MKLRYTEVLRQEYSGNNCVFSGGFVRGHSTDKVYLRLKKDGKKSTTILLRPDELAAIAWISSGILWSNEMKHMMKKK